MNSVIYKERSCPTIRFQIQGLYMGQRLNKIILNKKSNFILCYYFLKIIFDLINEFYRIEGSIS